MAPPSQAGRFKPRKPAKKIRPGASTGAPVVPPPAPASSAAAAGRRGGRGGRGGRGRHVIQQGQAFFGGSAVSSSEGAGNKTGLAASVARRLQGSTTSRGSRRLTAVKQERRETDTQEEIVGMLEEGIGGSVPDNVKSIPKLLRKDNDADAGPSGAFHDDPEELAAPPPSAFEYDSDSSLEVDRSRSSSNQLPAAKPLNLPFPSNPSGVASTAGDPMDDESSSSTSPLITHDKEDWFLLQFPTRLPPLAGTVDAATALGDEPSEISEVATVPLRKECFDHSLVHATPGKIGKFVVYESGKTVLFLNGQDGREYQLDVREGLSCSFRQQAAVIDSQSNQYIALGDVSKVVVVTPDIETAFSGSM